MATGNIFESNEPQQGERATENAHRKLELQSPQDLAYLVAAAQREALKKLDKHLPPDAAPEGEDEMRKRIAELVYNYIHDTFDSAKHSMSINGMDSGEMDAELAKAEEGEEIEPFDTKLAQRIQALSSDVESRTLHLAKLRRERPAEASHQFVNSFQRESERYDGLLQKDQERQLALAQTANVRVSEVERVDEIESSLQAGTEQLTVLKSGLGSTVAKMERAQQAVDVL